MIFLCIKKKTKTYFQTIFNLHHLQFFLSLNFLVFFTKNRSWNTQRLHFYSADIIRFVCGLEIRKQNKCVSVCVYLKSPLSYVDSNALWSVPAHSRHTCWFQYECGRTERSRPSSLRLRGSMGRGHSEPWAAGIQLRSNRLINITVVINHLMCAVR